MSETQPLGTATAERPASETTAGSGHETETFERPPLRERRLGWWPVLAVAVAAVVLGALVGFGLGRATGGGNGGNGGPGGFGGPGRGGTGQFQGGFPGQQGQQGQQGQVPGQQGQQGGQFGGPQGQTGQLPSQQGQLPSQQSQQSGTT